MRRKLPYRADLDGLRAFAIAGVMLFHLEKADAFSMPGGRIGVDVFFVLSGYLITTILITEMDRSGGIDLTAFYARRWLRLMPPFVLMLVVAWVIHSALPDPDTESYLLAAAAATTNTSNWVEIWRGIGILGHTWSLAIEQQYYLIWPIVLIVLSRRVRSRARIAAIIGWAVVVMWIARGIVFESDPRFAMFASITRADGVMIGSALGLLLDDPSPSVREFFERKEVLVSAALGIVAMAGFLHVNDLDALYLYGLIVVNVLTAFVVGGLTLTRSTIVHRVLEAPVVVGVGRISYGLYLFHIPIFYLVFDVKNWDDAGGIAFAVVGAFIAALFSSATVEAWARDLKTRLSRRAATVESPVSVPA
jgi:peptidoglycan/LPS O-acetylase OafA/YrhL